MYSANLASIYMIIRREAPDIGQAERLGGLCIGYALICVVKLFATCFVVEYFSRIYKRHMHRILELRFCLNSQLPKLILRKPHTLQRFKDFGLKRILFSNHLLKN